MDLEIMDVMKCVKRKRGIVLLHDGRQYYKWRTYKNGNVFWACSRLRKEKCRGSITVKNDNIVKRTEHICITDYRKNEIDIVIDELRQEVVNTDVPIPTAYKEKKKSNKNCVTLPSFASVKSVLYNSRKKTCFIDFQEATVPDNFHSFLLADYVSETRRIMIFCSERNKTRMVQLKEFFGDGTFYSCPNGFTQLYSIHAALDTSSTTTHVIPVAYALMTDKTEESYEILFSMLRSQIPEWLPSKFHNDFEIATSNALLSIFSDVLIIKCFYHFTNAQWKKAKKMKIKSKDGKRVVGLCAALALLPVEKIDEGWDYIQSDSPNTPKIKKYLQYFENTWLKNKSFRIQWSVYGQRHRTNNVVESWNAQLNKFMKRHNPITVSRLLKTLLDKESDSSEEPSPRRSELIYRDEFIQKCQMELIHSEIDVGYFLNKLR